LGVALTIFAIATLAIEARTISYLPLIGPAPLRFQTTARISSEPAGPASNSIATSVAPTEPSPARAQVNRPDSISAGPGIPAALKSLVRAPLWAALCDGLLLEPAPLVNPAPSPTPLPTPKTPPVVTAEMLVEFFRPGEPSTNASPPTLLPPVNFTPPTLLVWPSSRATYHSP
jgi:hypothetical protein